MPSEAPRFKLGVFASGSVQSHLYPDAYYRDGLRGRWVVGVREAPLDWLRRLAGCFEPIIEIRYLILHSFDEQTVPTGEYRAPAPASDVFEALLNRYHSFLELDARHQLGLVGRAGLSLTYDEHQLIYAYGPPEVYRSELQPLREMPFTVPFPHTHPYHEAFDNTQREWMSELAWDRLRPGACG